MHVSSAIRLRLLHRAALAFLLLAFAAGMVRAAAMEPLEIVTKGGVRVFNVEVAITPEEHATGLMNRRELPRGTGMLFDFGEPQMASFWMKDTYISLDMLFIAADGTIVSIAEDTTPLSLQPIMSPGPVKAVLEVVAGTSRRQGIAPGDQVGHRIFRR
jgi:uncharacterized membrane protein (UPF0127 family)